MRRSDLGDEAAVDDAMKWLDGLLGRIQAAADPGRPVARATLLGAQAEARRAAGKPDADAYARAAAAWEQLGRPEPAAQMRWRQAEALALAGDPDPATAAVRTAHAAALRLGAEGLRADVERLAVRARL